LRVYDCTGEPCRFCGTPIQKTRVGGRGTHFCPSCQISPRKES
jgi:formamidopyrimidine-DNA glycosylase